ncbi:methyltransferase [Lutimonas sp.]|uniref:methyltransferase n=1 Tax=Lutimonas sp. TaxID=1872403 RepID=UPI003D9BE7AB
MNQIDPSKIMQIGMGFWASKTLLTAVNMNLFTLLAKGEKSAKEIQESLGLHDRSVYDFLDTLVALQFLNRNGIKENATYSNAEDVDFFLDKNKLTYIGGILEMSNNRLYPFWNNLEEALKTGEPQNESKAGGDSMFDAIYANPETLAEFLHAMGGVQAGNFDCFARNFNFSNIKTLCDIGGAGGNLCVHVAKNNEHMNCLSFDLPQVESIANNNFKQLGLNGRAKAVAGDFFTDDLPNAELITMCNVLHDWGLKDKKMLLKKAFDALPENGTLAVIENVIDNERNKNAFGLMMSLNMLIETDEGFDYSFSDIESWAKEIGFKSVKLMPLTGPTSAVIAIK